MGWFYKLFGFEKARYGRCYLCGEDGKLEEYYDGISGYGEICFLCREALEIESRPIREEKAKRFKEKVEKGQAKWRKKRDDILNKSK